MKKTILSLSILAGFLVTSQVFAASACCPSSAVRPGNSEPVRAQMSPARLVLASYEKVSSALAADKLTEARSAARTLAVLGQMATQEDIAKSAKLIIEADSLEKARTAFRKVSAEAVKLAANEEGFYVMNCPTNGRDAVWVQNDPNIRNPYNGSKALECGIIIKGGETASASPVATPGVSS